MPVPKKRTSHSRKNQRRAHDALSFDAAVEICDNCGEPHLRHHVCSACGNYRGRIVFDFGLPQA